VAETAASQLRERLREVAALVDLSPDRRLWRGLLVVFTFVEEHRDAWATLYPYGGSTGGPVGQAASQAQMAMSELLGELLADTAAGEGVSPQAASESAALAHALTAATIAAASWWLGHPAESKELQALRIMNLAWMGFGNLLEGRFWLPSE
jgi:hypothetical protein